MNDYTWHLSGKELIDDIRKTAVSAGSVCIWPMGQCGFIIKTHWVTIGIDLVLSQLYAKDGSPRRQYPPPFGPEDGLLLEYLLVSHNHSDHLDIPTVTGLLNTNSGLKVLIPAAVKNEITLHDDRIIWTKQDKPVHIPGGSVTGIAAPHDTYRYDAGGNSLALGYVIRQQEIILYHSGDALADKKMADTVQNYHPEIVFLPINGRDEIRTKAGIIGNMTMEEAVTFAKRLAPKIFIPMHYDMFANNGYDVEACCLYAAKLLPDTQTIVPYLGKRLEIQSDAVKSVQ